MRLILVVGPPRPMMHRDMRDSNDFNRNRPPSRGTFCENHHFSTTILHNHLSQIHIVLFCLKECITTNHRRDLRHEVVTSLIRHRIATVHLEDHLATVVAATNGLKTELPTDTTLPLTMSFTTTATLSSRTLPTAKTRSTRTDPSTTMTARLEVEAEVEARQDTTETTSIKNVRTTTALDRNQTWDGEDAGAAEVIGDLTGEGEGGVVLGSSHPFS